MTSKVEFPIRVKLLLLVSSITLVSTIIYLLLAIELFKDDKTSLIYELNASNVKTLSAQVEAALVKVVDKINLLSQTQGVGSWAKSVLATEPDLVSFSLYHPDPGGKQWNVVSSVRSAAYLKLYGLGISEVDQLREKIPVPFDRVLAKRAIVMNSTLPSGAPIITIAISIDVHGSESGARNWIAVADLRADRFLRWISNRGISTVYLVDGEGRTIAHPDASRVTSRASLQEIPIVNDAIHSPLALELKRFSWEGKKWIGAYSAVGFGNLFVISQIEDIEAFRAFRKLLNKTFLFALLVFTAALLFTTKMARSFTQPLERLLKATTQLSKSELSESIYVKTRDEIAHLARAFNTMTHAIQNQRQQLDTNRQELELKVKERTSALETQKQQLLEAQDALIRTTRLASLGELAGVAAHEVLNPLNNMNIRVERMGKPAHSSFQEDAELLQEISGEWGKVYKAQGWEGLKKEFEKKDRSGKRSMLEEDLENLDAIGKSLSKSASSRKEDLDFLSREISRINRIVSNMRSLSRVGGERRPVDVHVPLDETILTLADVAEKRNVAIIKDYGPETRARYSIIGDKDELVQVFSNLLRNAFQAITSAHRGSGSIRVSTHRANDPQRVEIRITDNGTGIHSEHLARIFEPSFTTKTVEEGTGLGLSISRRLVRAFGGDIEIEKTSPDEGTTFLIWFPAANG